MTTVRTYLTIIQIKWAGKKYNVKCESIKDTDKQDIEKVYASDSHQANYVTFGKTEYSIDLSGVQSYRWLFERMREVQNSGGFAYQFPQLVIFKYNDTGKVVVDKYYSEVFCEEISGENQDPFDVKLVAMKRAYTDNKGNYF